MALQWSNRSIREIILGEVLFCDSERQVSVAGVLADYFSDKLKKGKALEFITSDGKLLIQFLYNFAMKLICNS